VAGDGPETRQSTMAAGDVRGEDESDGERTGCPGLIRCLGMTESTVAVLLDISSGDGEHGGRGDSDDHGDHSPGDEYFDERERTRGKVRVRVCPGGWGSPYPFLGVVDDRHGDDRQRGRRPEATAMALPSSLYVRKGEGLRWAGPFTVATGFKCTVVLHIFPFSFQ
jgi:hypothetical protein